MAALLCQLPDHSLNGRFSTSLRIETVVLHEEVAGARQIVRLLIDLVQTSSGPGVPLFDYKQGMAASCATGRRRASTIRENTGV